MAPTTTRTDAKNWTTMTEGEVMDADGTESAAVTSSPPPKKRRKLGCVRFSELVVEFAAPGGHKPFTAEEPKQNFYTRADFRRFKNECQYELVLHKMGFKFAPKYAELCTRGIRDNSLRPNRKDMMRQHALVVLEEQSRLVQHGTQPADDVAECLAKQSAMSSYADAQEAMAVAKHDATSGYRFHSSSGTRGAGSADCGQDTTTSTERFARALASAPRCRSRINSSSDEDAVESNPPSVFAPVA